MNLLKANELKVGLMVVLIAGLVGAMSMQVSDNPNLFSSPRKVYFLLPDAAGLVKGSAVKMAGIPVGTIRNISLQDGQARVDLGVSPDIPLYQTAAIELKSQGILGDRYIEIYPGSPTDPPIESGDQILRIRSKGSIDGLVNEFIDLGKTVNEIAVMLKESMAENGTRAHSIGRIVNNIEKLTQDLSEITAENKDKVGEIVDQVRNVTATLDEILNEEGPDGFKAQWDRSLAHIDSSLKNIDEITGKINRGEGTIGKLVNDESTIEEVNSAVSGINNYLDAANKVQTGIDVNSYYLGQVGAAKTNISLIIQPGLDRYYMLGVVDDPAGVVETTETKTTTGGNTTETKEVKTYKNKVKFSAQFAKNFYNFTVRGGLIENTGGVGFDYKLFRDKLILSLEAFDFTQLNLRAQAKYNIYRGIYVLGGFSDILDKSNKYSNYLGAGLSLTNDDLKLLLTKSPF